LGTVCENRPRADFAFAANQNSPVRYKKIFQKVGVFSGGEKVSVKHHDLPRNSPQLHHDLPS
jgi:hypothetical protein